MQTRRMRVGHYSDHGLGREMQWYDDWTRLFAEDGDLLDIEGAGYEAQITYRPVEGKPIPLGRNKPYHQTHAEAVAYWTERFASFKAGDPATT